MSIPAQKTCPDCGKPTHYKKTLVTMWLGAELNVIDDVPAHVCDNCGQQSYEPEIEAEIRALVAQGFPGHKAVNHISVPVFRLDSDRREIDPVAAAHQIQTAQEVSQS